MRLVRLAAADIRLLFRYKIVPLYILVTAVYLILLAVLPVSVRETAGNFLLFTDPAAMGLFFMGAAVMLEKSERTLSSLAVSPVRVWEYAISKCIALAAVGTASGVVLTAAGGLLSDGNSFLLKMAGLFFGSCLFSLMGLAAAYRAKDLNQFLIFVVPAELILCLPGVLEILGVKLPGVLVLIHPGAAAAWMLMGGSGAGFGMVSLAVFTAAGCAAVCRILSGDWEGRRREKTGKEHPGDRDPGSGGASDDGEEADKKVQRGSAESANSNENGKIRAGQNRPYPKGKPARCIWRLFVRQLNEDVMLVGALVVPVFCAAALRFGIPALEHYLCGRLDRTEVLGPYYLLFDLLNAAIAPLMCAYIAAMIMLEEKDNGTAGYYFVTPAGKWGYLLSRIVYPGIVSGIYTTVLLLFLSLSRPGVWKIVFMAFMGVIMGIHALLLVLAAAGNKVEGMGLIKLSSLLLAGFPAAFLISGGFRFAFYLFPSYWAAVFAGKAGGLEAAAFLITSVLLAWVLWKQYERKRSR